MYKFTKMDKFLGILFFYVLSFNENGFERRSLSYLQEKSLRYLGFEITKDQWKLLTRSGLRKCNADSADYLKQSELIDLINVFEDVFELKNIDFGYRMYGITEDQENETKEGCFNELHKVISILCSSYGVGLVFGDWLSNTFYDRNMIESVINRIENINSVLNN